MFNLTFKEKLQSIIRRAHSPSSTARERCKTVFLSAVKTSFPHTTLPLESGVFKFKYFTKGFVAALALVALAGGVTTYADYADVGTENALYPLKRTSESVRLSLTNEEKKPALHLELANRRLKEMKAVKEEARAEKLAQDFTNEIKQSIVITISVPVTATAVLEATTSMPQPASPLNQTLQIEMPNINNSNQETNKNTKGRSRDTEKKSDIKKIKGNIELAGDPFCDQLEEMVLDPEPTIRAITSRDPVLHALVSERCDFESFFDHPIPKPNGIQLATTSLPVFP